MAALTHIDTHVLVWATIGDERRLSVAAVQSLDQDELAVSPMVGMELSHLFERGRITSPAHEVLTDARHALGLVVAQDRFDQVVDVAHGLTWTRDPFDRLIAAHAIVAGARLLTRDEHIRAHVDAAFW